MVASRPVPLANQDIARLYERFVDHLRSRLENPKIDRDVLCRDLLTEIHYGEGARYADLIEDGTRPVGERMLIAQLDPRNVTLEAENIPPSFPIHRAQTTLDYGFADIAGHEFLLPLHSQTDMTLDRGLSRNEIDFRFYRKYSADTEIKYDITPDPLPADVLKESPPGAAKVEEHVDDELAGVGGDDVVERIADSIGLDRTHQRQVFDIRR